MFIHILYSNLGEALDIYEVLKKTNGGKLECTQENLEGEKNC